MNSKVIKLADLDQFTVNPDYKTINVTEEEIQGIMESMASNMGGAVSIDAWEENSCAVCRTADGQKMLLYPSLNISGVEKAAEEVKGMQIGDSFVAMIKDQEYTLTVEQFLVNRALPLNDELAKACAIEAVDTLEQLKAYLKSRETEKKREENIRQLVMEYVQFMLENSQVELDEEEMAEWCVPEAKRVYEEELSFGIDLRFTEDGQMITEEEALERLAEELKPQFVVRLIQRQFGEENGFVPDSSEAEYGDPYDVFMYETFSAKAKEELS